MARRAAERTKDKKDGVRNKFSKDKGKKGSDKHGKSKDDGKGKDKGKLHKGVGKDPHRSEAHRFGGKCNWCWRLGHKENQCWFRQAYEKYSKAREAYDKQQGHDHPQKPSDTGSADIRNFMQNKRARHEPAGEDSKDGKMDIGGIMVDERFIYALFDGEFDIELDSDIEGEEMTDNANSQSAWWKKYIDQQWQPDCPDEERSTVGEQHRSLKIGPVMELETVNEEDYESSIVDQYERHWGDGPGESYWGDDAMMHPWVQEDVIDQFLNSDRHEDGTSCQYIFSVWQVPEADDEDEDNGGNAQSMTVPQHASRGDDDGDAQSMTVPQHASPGDDDGNAQSMTVPQHARRSNAAEMDMEMENLEREMLEAESAEEEIQERLDRNRELQSWIENELVRQRWQREEMLENAMIRWCKSTNLVPYASPKASKGSLGRGERAHLSVQGQMDVQDACREEVLHQDAAEPLPERMGLSTCCLDHQQVPAA